MLMLFCHSKFDSSWRLDLTSLRVSTTPKPLADGSISVRRCDLKNCVVASPQTKRFSY
jgi:hypothetical protein